MSTFRLRRTNACLFECLEELCELMDVHFWHLFHMGWSTRGRFTPNPDYGAVDPQLLSPVRRHCGAALASAPWCEIMLYSDPASPSHSALLARADEVIE